MAIVQTNAGGHCLAAYVISHLGKSRDKLNIANLFLNLTACPPPHHHPNVSHMILPSPAPSSHVPSARLSYWPHGLSGLSR